MPYTGGFLRGTVSDIAIAQGADQVHTDIIEFQKQTNPILDEMVFQQCNNMQVHKATVRTALPEVAWRMLNRGIAPSKSGKGQVTFTCGQMMALAQIDEDEVALNGGNEYRLAENRAFQIQMNNVMAGTLFYGDEKVNPAGFTGFGAYYFSSDPAKCKAADYVIDAGGTGGNLSSIYLVFWDTSAIHGIFPANTKAGFEYRDNGRVKGYDFENKELYVLESQYKWYMGLAVKDYRQAVRIANIDTAAAVTGASPNMVMQNLIEAYNRIENTSLGRGAIYCNRNVKAMLDKMAMEKAVPQLSVAVTERGPVTNFWGLPIRRCDALLNTESAVD